MRHFHSPRHGASAILNLFMFPVFLIFALISINLANVQRHRVSSQISCDMASRYCTNMLARDEPLSKIRYVANQMAGHTWQGRLDGTYSVDVEFGAAVARRDDVEFVANARPMNSVRVTSNHAIPAYGVGSGASIPIKNSSTSAVMERDVCLVIDRSGSMTFDLDTGSWMPYYYTYHPLNYLLRGRYSYYRHYWWRYRAHPTRSRWSTMIPAVYGLADELSKTKQSERFSIVSFSTGGSVNWFTNEWNPRRERFSRNKADIEVGLTSNYRSAAQQFDNLYKTTKLVTGGTDISAGIDLAKNVLMTQGRRHAFKTIIVMTDGQYTSGRAPWLAATDAANEGIEVFTVTFSRHADQGAMVRTADMGNGEHFHAPDGDSLEEIFRKIANIPPNVRIE